MTAPTPRAIDVITAKRDGGRLTDEQIDWVLAAYTRGDVADEQMASLAMAILLNGMDAAEISRWTQAMIDSGEVLSFGDIGRPLVDKHSTGGVGDKITLPLAPLVAACGAAVPQLSGRGLGHTGGTLDKLESIPGWRASLSLEEIAAQLADVGAVVCATTPTLAPADRKLYALRDVTGTVESIPLIASSIMSKKIAEGTGGLVLDVKVGSGAFMKTPARARELAETMVRIGTAHGLATTALLTDMSVPLGRAVGNALEVAESVEVLRGGGPADVVALTVALAREMLLLAGISGVDPADVLASGADLGCIPCGFTALDLLRVESSLLFYPFDMSETYPYADGSPPGDTLWELGLTFTVTKGKKAFRGADAHRRLQGKERFLIFGVLMDAPDAPATAGGDAIFCNGERVGVITGGMRSSLTNRSLAIARLTVATAKAGTPLQVHTAGGEVLAAKAHMLPFDDPTKSKRMAKG